MPRSIIVVPALLLFALTDLQADWPKFRGPGGDGHSPGDAAPLKWSATENLNWQVAVPGKGWSSPVVVAGRVYLTTAVAEGDDQDAGGVDRQLRVLCLDAGDGRVVWDVKVFDQDGAGAPKIHKKNSHASPTPIVDGERLYVHFGHMGTACLDLQGKVLWRQRFGYKPVHGNGGSPILSGKLLIYSADAAQDPFIIALDKDSGKVVWKTPRSETPAKRKFSFSTPTLVDVGGRAQIISPASGAVFAYDPATGKELWHLRYDQGYSVIPKPVYHDGMVFIGTGYDTPKALGINIGPGMKGDVTGSHLAWEIGKRAPHTPSMLVVDGLLYFVSDGGIASCVEPKTGEVIWQERAARPMSASPVHAAGRIYFLDEQGVCTVVKAGREFEVLAENDIGERALASMAFGGGAIFLRTEKHLFCIGE